MKCWYLCGVFFVVVVGLFSDSTTNVTAMIPKRDILKTTLFWANVCGQKIQKSIWSLMMQKRPFITLYRYQLEPSDWHLVTFFMTYILYDIYFFHRFFVNLKMAHIQWWLIWIMMYDFISHHIIYAWTGFWFITLSSPAILWCVPFFSRLDVYFVILPIYANRQITKPSVVCSFLFVVVGSFVPKLEWVSYEGIESKTVIYNRCCYLYVYVYVSLCALCVNKYHFHL